MNERQKIGLEIEALFNLTWEGREFSNVGKKTLLKYILKNFPEVTEDEVLIGYKRYSKNRKEPMDIDLFKTCFKIEPDSFIKTLCQNSSMFIPNKKTCEVLAVKLIDIIKSHVSILKEDSVWVCVHTAYQIASELGLNNPDFECLYKSMYCSSGISGGYKLEDCNPRDYRPKVDVVVNDDLINKHGKDILYILDKKKEKEEQELLEKSKLIH